MQNWYICLSGTFLLVDIESSNHWRIFSYQSSLNHICTSRTRMVLKFQKWISKRNCIPLHFIINKWNISCDFNLGFVSLYTIPMQLNVALFSNNWITPCNELPNFLYIIFLSNSIGILVFYFWSDISIHMTLQFR